MDKTKVKSSTRRTKSGKVINVKSYERENNLKRNLLIGGAALSTVAAISALALSKGKKSSNLIKKGINEVIPSTPKVSSVPNVKTVKEASNNILTKVEPVTKQSSASTEEIKSAYIKAANRELAKIKARRKKDFQRLRELISPEGKSERYRNAYDNTRRKLAGTVDVDELRKGFKAITNDARKYESRLREGGKGGLYNEVRGTINQNKYFDLLSKGKEEEVIQSLKKAKLKSDKDTFYRELIRSKGETPVRGSGDVVREHARKAGMNAANKSIDELALRAHNKAYRETAIQSLRDIRKRYEAQTIEGKFNMNTLQDIAQFKQGRKRGSRNKRKKL